MRETDSVTVTPTTGPWKRSDTCVRESLPTRTVTLLLVEAESSARLWETQPQAMAAALARLDHVVAELVATYDGVGPVKQDPGNSGAAAFWPRSRSQPMLWRSRWICSGRRWRRSGYVSGCIRARWGWAPQATKQATTWSPRPAGRRGA